MMGSRGIRWRSRTSATIRSGFWTFSKNKCLFLLLFLRTSTSWAPTSYGTCYIWYIFLYGLFTRPFKMIYLCSFWPKDMFRIHRQEWTDTKFRGTLISRSLSVTEGLISGRGWKCLLSVKCCVPQADGFMSVWIWAPNTSHSNWQSLKINHACDIFSKKTGGRPCGQALWEEYRSDSLGPPPFLSPASSLVLLLPGRGVKLKSEQLKLKHKYSHLQI